MFLNRSIKRKRSISEGESLNGSGSCSEDIFEDDDDDDDDSLCFSTADSYDGSSDDWEESTDDV